MNLNAKIREAMAHHIAIAKHHLIKDQQKVARFFAEANRLAGKGKPIFPAKVIELKTKH